MFATSDSEDEGAQESTNREGRLHRLVKARKKDMREEYEEQEEYHSTRKRRKPDTDSEDDSDFDPPIRNEGQAHSSPKPKRTKTAAEAMMEKMGYVEGTGLGRHGQGRPEAIPLSSQKGRIGLGHEASKVLSRDLNTTWDESVEDKTHEETVEWMNEPNEESRQRAVRSCDTDEWVSIGQEKLSIEDETKFCDGSVLQEMLRAKTVFDVMNDRDLREARTRANPYETVGAAFFQNRAAMKTANLDKIFSWIFSRELDERARLEKNPLNLEVRPRNADRDKSLFYFADVCAGPGGFSEYMLWRKGFYNAKGFGFTLCGKDDFKLGKFSASSPHFFEPFYGKHNDGDVMNPENIDSLEDFIKKGTGGLGVHLMMADGGFSVEGKENIQEILSKRLYLCQLLVSLCIVREGGNFFCKLFDIFTQFSAGLVYLMRICYGRVSLHKPHTSRPANSERYIICEGLRKEFSDSVRDYLKRINLKLDEFKKMGSKDDVTSCVPLDVLKGDKDFFIYLVRHNERMTVRQTTYLNKYLRFSKNQGLIDKDQADLREKCLDYWMIPNRPRQKDRDQQRFRLNPFAILTKFIPPIGCQELSMKVPDFCRDVLCHPSEKQLKFAEWSCSLVSDRNQPKLLVASKEAVFIFDRDWTSHSSFDYRVPENSILLVEETSIHEYEKGRLRNTRQKMIRIVDAAVLNGDDVSGLSYSKRMKAASKFCAALMRVEPTVRVGYGPRTRYTTVTPIVAARVLDVQQLPDIKHELSRTLFEGSEIMTYQEQGHTLVCAGVRFVRNLKPEWKMGWSRTNQHYYGFNARTSMYENELEKQGHTATFWENSIMRLSRQCQGPSLPQMQYIWRWLSHHDSGYCSRVIVEEKSHPGGLTLSEISNLISLAKSENGVPY